MANDFNIPFIRFIESYPKTAQNLYHRFITKAFIYKVELLLISAHLFKLMIVFLFSEPLY